MSKYDVDGGFERVERDWYPTPLKATMPLKTSPIGGKPLTYWEPCCGDGSLVRHLKNVLPESNCVVSSDIVTDCGLTKNVFDINASMVETTGTDYFITNPPWVNTSKDEFQLFRIIAHLAALKPTLLLLNANLCWNKNSWNHKLAPMPICHWVKPIGRVKWIEDSPHTGKEDCAWYLFYSGSSFAKMMPTAILPRD